MKEFSSVDELEEYVEEIAKECRDEEPRGSSVVGASISKEIVIEGENKNLTVDVFWEKSFWYEYNLL